LGVFRLLLALSVVIGHAGPVYGYSIFPAQFSVIVFFILSGFYMALVINEKYGNLPNGTAIFYEARFLRLYPAYAIILLASIAVQNWFLMPNVFFVPDPSLGWWQRALYITLNVTVIGQDVASSFDPTFHLFQNHPVSIAWTIGTEALFYLLAPFIVRLDTWRLAVLLAAISMIIRTAMFDLPADPWRYRLLPSVLIFFLLGCAAYHGSAAIMRSNLNRIARSIGKVLFWGGLFGIGALVAVKGYAVPDLDLDAPLYWFAYLGVAAAIPFLHAYLGSNWIDRRIGLMTYPVYICHNLIVAVLVIAIARQSIWFSPLVIGLVLLVGAALNLFVEEPINAYRAALARGRGLSLGLPATPYLPAPRSKSRGM
jgi:peptidoglycan/LPS O-acetylase OafA/YrhL